MKPKVFMLIGILCSIIMIGYSVYQGGNVYEVKRKYNKEMEQAQKRAMLTGGSVQKTEKLKPYASESRTAGKVTMTLTLVLLSASLISVRIFKKMKGLFIFHIIGIILLAVSAVFSLVMMTTTGAATFDETFVVWVLFGLIGIVLFGLSLKKFDKIIPA